MTPALRGWRTLIKPQLVAVKRRRTRGTRDFKCEGEKRKRCNFPETRITRKSCFKPIFRYATVFFRSTSSYAFTHVFGQTTSVRMYTS